jgi:hypothetical protein
MLVIGVIVLIIIIAVVLSAMGAWIVIQGRHEQEPPTYAPIDRSGSFAVLRHPAREDLERKKPSAGEVELWIRTTYPQKPADEVMALVEKWKADIEHTISVIEEGDREKVATFLVLLTEKDIPLCQFLTTDNYLTREQIINHPEILPPFYLGCNCKIALKQPWDNPSKSGWKAVTPGPDGKYHVPDWRTIA